MHLEENPDLSRFLLLVLPYLVLLLTAAHVRQLLS